VINAQSAINFVLSSGDPVELARLRYLLDGEPPAPAIIQQLFTDQREDGGWSPFWAADYSSLDATCFRLGQAEQLGLNVNEFEINRALNFLVQRQQGDGSWEEDARVAEQAPPWATPGDLAAHLYLTANCGFWLVVWGDTPDHVLKAASYLQRYLNETGQMPSFVHTHWLAAGLWYRLHLQYADHVFGFLSQQISSLPVSNLAWLLSTLLLAGVPAEHSLIQRASSLLMKQQKQDGRWLSEDGPERDVHATLESLRVLRICHRF
jgi:hypothetical protein